MEKLNIWNCAIMSQFSSAEMSLDPTDEIRAKDSMYYAKRLNLTKKTIIRFSR